MLEFLEVQEEYIKDEQRNLKKEYLHAQEEVKRIQSVPLVIGQFLEAVDQNTGIGKTIILQTLSTIIYLQYSTKITMPLKTKLNYYSLISYMQSIKKNIIFSNDGLILLDHNIKN